MFWTTGSVILILLKPLLGEISEDDRDLSTDILEYVLRRGEGKNDSTIASDILGFVKNKIEDSTFEEIPPEIFKFVLESLRSYHGVRCHGAAPYGRCGPASTRVT